MKLIALAPVLSLLFLAVQACPGEEHDHVHEKRLPPSSPIAPPTRPLVWGDINVIHSTDTHGWLLGHQKPSFPEPNYSGDFGDFASFVTHMKQLAVEKDVDLLLVDSGDVHDGTGLSDGFPAGQVDAAATNPFLTELPYDVMTIGNHEIDLFDNALQMFQTFAPKLGDRYLTSNVNITVADKHGKPVSVPIGQLFRKFTTRKGRKVTSVGVLFDFTGNDVNTTVQKVEDMVKEKWFLNAIAEEPDFFLLIGHMPVQKDNWPTVWKAVRAVHPTTPILIFGGHSHIRDCVQFDGRTMALESGRYMETVGWMSANLDRKGSTKNITFSRRYLDPNRVTYEFHTSLSNRTFDTFLGQQITKGLLAIKKNFDLDFLFGTAPQDFTISRSPFPSNGSLPTLVGTQVLPVALSINNTRANIPSIMITNTGSLRFDIFKGPFDKNDQLTASPFMDTFLFIPNVPAGVAKNVLPSLNGAGADEKRELSEVLEKRERIMYERGSVDGIYKRWLEEMHRRTSPERRAAKNLTLGYVTSDACPGVGDDSAHTPLPFFDTPDFIGSNTPNVTDDTPIDLVFVDFIETQLLGIVNSLQTAKNFTTADVQSYTPILASQVLGLFAQKNWN